MNAISGDRPLGAGDVDRLGFATLARRLAKALVSQTSPAGMVVGVEGAWGSGKSSLMYLTLTALRADEIAKPAVVEFRPWLIGDRDALLTALFGDLAKAIAAIELQAGDATGVTNAFLKKTANTVRDFAIQLEAPGKALKVVKDFVPGAGTAGAALEGLSKAAKATIAGPSLSKLKDDLNQSLAKLPCRIVVAIDDVDRLEPREAIELLRLVRSVADFPNVVYVLCYDQPVLAQSVQIATKVKDGRAYLEKIIQVTVPVPIPEPFDLRLWFAQDLKKFAAGRDPDAQARIDAVIDSEGGRRLTTPRAVVRALNSLSFVWPALADEVDLADLIWLHLIRAQNPDLYRWIEDYSAGASANASWRVVIGEEERDRMRDELETLLKAEGRSLEGIGFFQLAEHLAGLGRRHSPTKGSQVSMFERMDGHSLAQAIRDRRLKSPDHYRLYFALTQPEHAPRQADYDAFWEASATSEAISGLLAQWAHVPMGTAATKVDVMLDRLRGEAERAIDGAVALKLIEAFALTMEGMIDLGGRDSWGEPAAWRAAERLMPILVPKARAHKPKAYIKSFKTGPSLSWLTNLLRDELVAHGRLGDQGPRPGDCTMTDEELDAVVEIMKPRLAALSFDQIHDSFRPWMVIYTRLVIDPGPTRALIDAGLKNDIGFLRALETLSGRVRSGEDEYKTLKADRLEPFMDGQAARARAVRLAKRPGKVGAQARAVLEMFEAGDHF